MRITLWALAMAVILVIAGISESWLLSWVFYALAGALLLAGLMTAKVREHIFARRYLLETQLEIGQEATVEIAFAWKSALGAGWVMPQDEVPPALETLDPTGQLFVTRGRHKTRYTYRVIARKRGYHPIGPLTVSCGDLFGISRRDAPQRIIDYVTVYPRVVPIPMLRLPSNRPIGESHSSQRLFEDPTRTIGIRDYTQGDSLRQVHWKATARAGRLIARICEPSSSTEVNIVLNMFRDDYQENEEAVELACTAAASLAGGLLMDRCLVGIQTNGTDALWRRGLTVERSVEDIWVKADRRSAQLSEILAVIARLELCSDLPLSTYLLHIHSRLSWTATLVIITHRLGDGCVQVLDNLRRSGFALAVILVGTGQVAEDALTRTAGLGIPVAWLQSEDQLAHLEFWRPA